MVRELATGKERQLTFDRKNVDEVVWATNDEIFFVSNKSGQTNLWMIPAGGGEATQITQGAVPICGPRISADNKVLLYMQTEDIAHIWISAVDGSNAQQVTSPDISVTSASFSLEGKHISYVAKDIDPYNPEVHLYVMDRDGKNQRQLTSGSENDSRGRWSPDGRWLAFLSWALGEPPDSNRICLIQPFNPGPPQLLCKGKWCWWANNESLYVFCQMRTLRYSIKGGAPTQVYQDSTQVFPKNRNGDLTFVDYRGVGTSGW